MRWKLTSADVHLFVGPVHDPGPVIRIGYRILIYTVSLVSMRRNNWLTYREPVLLVTAQAQGGSFTNLWRGDPLSTSLRELILQHLTAIGLETSQVLTVSSWLMTRREAAKLRDSQSGCPRRMQVLRVLHVGPVKFELIYKKSQLEIVLHQHVVQANHMMYLHL